MKIFWTSSVILLLLSIGGNAQTKSAAKAEASDVTTVSKNAVPREKFDPLRNAKADLEAAITKASASGRRIILDVGGEWCGWCVYMDRFFVENPPLAKLRDDNFVWVKVNFSDQNENTAFLAAYPTIVAYPHIFVLDASGKLLLSKNTEELEDGKRYSLAKFTEFLNAWAPAKKQAD